MPYTNYDEWFQESDVFENCGHDHLVLTAIKNKLMCEGIANKGKNNICTWWVCLEYFFEWNNTKKIVKLTNTNWYQTFRNIKNVPMCINL